MPLGAGVLQKELHGSGRRGRSAISEESTELRFVRPEEIDRLPMHHTQRLRVRHFLEGRERPYLG
nr:hypothetical protein [Streptomyces benahoarensis]